MKLKKFPIVIALSILSSLIVASLYLMGFNLLTSPPKTAEELLKATGESGFPSGLKFPL